MKRLFAAFTAMLLLGLTAHADNHQKADEDKADSNKRICKMVKVPGNRTKTKVCQPQSFWDEQMEIEKRVAAGGRAEEP